MAYRRAIDTAGAFADAVVAGSVAPQAPRLSMAPETTRGAFSLSRMAA